MISIEELRVFRAGIYREHRRLTELVHEAFPIGSLVTYMHGSHQIVAEVVMHTPHGGRLKVVGRGGTA